MTRRRVTWDSGTQRGWLIEFITASYNEYGEIAPLALVERDNGLIERVDIGARSGLQFVTPYKPHADWEPQEPPAPMICDECPDRETCVHMAQGDK